MQVILANSIQDAMIEIAITNDYNTLITLEQGSIPGYNVIHADTLDDILVAGQDDLFGNISGNKLILLRKKLDLNAIQLADADFLILDSEIYKTSDIPKTKSLQILKKTKVDGALIRAQIAGYLEARSITSLSSKTIKQLGLLESLTEVSQALSICLLAPELSEQYLALTHHEAETPLFWLQFSESSLEAHAKTWCARVKTDEEVAMSFALLLGKLQKSSPHFARMAISNLIKADRETKSSNKMSTLTVFRRFLYTTVESAEVLE
jgi:hypothetical protein